MNKKYFFLVLFVLNFFAGCGYTTRSLLPSSFKTIYIEPFKNSITYTSEKGHTTYLPLLEVKIRNAVVDRFLFDGNLDVAEAETADLILKGVLKGYQRDALRYTDSNDVQEYRINIITSLTLWDPMNNKAVWEESDFIGQTTYFPVGPQSKSESTAVEDALVDLARRIVERTVEDW